MKEEISEMSKKLEDHERRIKELEKYIHPKEKVLRKDTTTIDDAVEAFKSLDLTEYDYIYDLAAGSYLYLAILLIAKEKLGIDGLTPPEISKICKDKIRISVGVDRTTISNHLRDARSQVDRIDNPRGRGYAYRIMRKGELLIQELVSGHQ